MTLAVERDVVFYLFRDTKRYQPPFPPKTTPAETPSQHQSYGVPSKKPVPGQALHIDDACYCLVSIGVRSKELFSRKSVVVLIRVVVRLAQARYIDT